MELTTETDEGRPAKEPASPHFKGDFDELIDLVGSFGRFQWRLFLLMQPPFMFLAFSYFSQIWLVLEPDHWCRVPTLQARGWSDLAARNLTAPLEQRGGLMRHSRCHMYDVNFTDVDPASWAPDNETAVVPCRHGWSYDFSEIYPTIVSDNDWVCDSTWKPTLASTLFFVGSMVGTVVFSYVADKFGRLPSLVLANLTCCVAGFATAFSTSLSMFAVLRFIVGMGNNLQCTQAIVLLSEFVGPRYRAMVVNLPLATSLCGAMVVLPWLARLLYHWTYLAMASSLPMSFVLLYYVLRVPESCRWLQHVGQIERAVQEMREIALENGKQVPDDTWKSFTVAAKRRHEEELTQRHPTLLDMLRLPRLRNRLLTLTIGTMVVLLQFDLIARTTELDVDVYTAQSVLGLTEAPADLLTWLLLETLGRRWTMSGSLLATSGLALTLAVLLRRGGLAVASTCVAFLCRCGATVAYNAIVQQQMELLAAFSPAVLQLARLDRGLPSFVLAAVTLLGAGVLSTLPETMNRPLPDTLEQGERFGSEQRYWQCFWHNPWRRRPAESDRKGLENPALEADEQQRTESADM
ncbi:solute carrier family 22 member 3-like [Pollicipes pollicipes]|uniref:solute carrier family 22 member 3-like n=1 Tax=Pollicipes pollicipes TaxID=41117 RepID=UPI0018858D39|nr:solute carrier family 22 member 3-like [Pollicipes pollicipes]